MKSRVALVVGGAGVIGAAIASRLASDGFLVSTADLSNADHAIDVSSEQQVRQLFGSFHELHCLVNAFGITSQGSFQSIGVAEWDRVQAVNLRGVF